MVSFRTFRCPYSQNLQRPISWFGLFLQQNDSSNSGCNHLSPNAFSVKIDIDKGPSLYYVSTYGWVGGPENGNFPLLYVAKMSLRGWVGSSKKAQNTAT